MQQAFQSLAQFVHLLQPLSTSELEAFISIWKPFSAKRKEQLTSVGEAERYLYFVVEGVQRVFYLDEQDREATLVFTYAPSFGGVLDSILLQRPSRYYYETITPSEFLRAPVIELHRLMAQFPAIQNLVQTGTSHALAGLLERLVEVQCYSSEEKFRALLRRSPHILQLVPHKYLASYLGIDVTNFSKLMNKVKI